MTFRLPEQKTFATDRVDALCRELTDLTGLVFIVWDADGRFWMPVGFSSTLTGLIGGSPSLREQARQAVTEVFQSSETSIVLLHDGVLCLHLPIRRRNRTLFVFTAAVLTEDRPSEALRDALSVAAGVSGSEAAQRLAGETSLPAVALPPLARLIERFATEYVQRLDAEEQVNDVSRKLSEGYEEITLYQRITSKIRVSQPSDAFFTATCSELMEFLDVEAIAALYCDKDHRSDPQIVSLGAVPLDNAQLLRLYHHFERELADGREAVIANDCSTSAELKALVPGVSNMILVPLRQGKKLYGVMAAFNKNDHVEFYSTDVKLVSSVSGTIAVFVENTHLYDDLQQLMLGTVKVLVSSIDAKDPYTCGHSERVASLSRRLGEQMGLPREDIDRVYLAGLLHDIGKIGVPEAILLKNGRLDPQEFDIMKTHSTIGARILAGVRELSDVIPGVLYHHERLDGRGYPKGLAPEAVPLDSRIIGLADAFDAMTSNRVYRPALSIEQVETELRRNTGTQFDVRCVDALMELGVADVLEQLLKQNRDVALAATLRRA